MKIEDLSEGSRLGFRVWVGEFTHTGAWTQVASPAHQSVKVSLTVDVPDLAELKVAATSALPPVAMTLQPITIALQPIIIALEPITIALEPITIAR